MISDWDREANYSNKLYTVESAILIRRCFYLLFCLDHLGEAAVYSVSTFLGCAKEFFTDQINFATLRGISEWIWSALVGV